MKLVRRVAFVLILLCVGTFALQDKNDLLHRLEATEKLVTSLSERVNLLESREIVHITRISDLESRDKEQQKSIEELQQQLQQKQHNSVKTTFNDPRRQLHDLKETTVDGSQDQYTNTSGVPLQVDTLETKQHSERSAQRIRQAAVETPVVFFASQTDHLTHEGIRQPLIFNNVQTNVGNAYSKHTGMFTAPVDGIYVFSATLVAYYHNNAYAEFFKNSISLNQMWASGVEANSDTTSATIALSLIKGDVIGIRNRHSDGSYYGSNMCSFTGFLLHELSITSVVVG